MIAPEKLQALYLQTHYVVCPGCDGLMPKTLQCFTIGTGPGTVAVCLECYTVASKAVVPKRSTP